MDFWMENVVIWCWNDVFQSDTQESVALLWPRDRSKWLSNALQRKFWASFRCTCTNHTSTQWEGGKAKNAPILDAQFWMVTAGVSKKKCCVNLVDLRSTLHFLARWNTWCGIFQSWMLALAFLMYSSFLFFGKIFFGAKFGFHAHVVILCPIPLTLEIVRKVHSICSICALAYSFADCIKSESDYCDGMGSFCQWCASLYVEAVIFNMSCFAVHTDP